MLAGKTQSLERTTYKGLGNKHTIATCKAARRVNISIFNQKFLSFAHAIFYSLSNIKDMEYRTVKVKGRFLHENEMLMGPRSYIRPDGVGTIGGLISQRDGGNGYLVVTPFKLSDRE